MVEAQSVRKEAILSQQAIVNKDFALAGEHVANASFKLDSIQSQLLFARVLYIVPWVGTQVKSTVSLVDSASDTLDIVRTLVSVGIDVESNLRAVGIVSGFRDIESFGSLSSEEKSELAFALKRAVPELEESRARLSNEREDLESSLERPMFFGLRVVTKELLEQIETLEETLELAVPTLAVLPDVAGFNGPQRYLLFLQNSGELRPTGGFWGTYGVVTVEDGEIVSIETDDVYAVDGPATGDFRLEPPYPLREYLGVENWYLRDINWSPDVPTSVRAGLEAYERETVRATGTVTAPRVDFDGVILVTPAVGTRLLLTLGSAEVGGVLFDANSFFDVLEYEVEQAFVDKGIPSIDRKDILGDLIQALLVRVQEADPETWGKIARLTTESLDEQDILLYHGNPEIQKVFSDLNWTGEMSKSIPGHDEFMIVDANLAAFKTDTAIRRSYEYHIEPLLDGRYQASLRINYKHTGDFDYRTTRYRTYVRVYVPQGSELVRVDGSLVNDKINNPNGEPGVPDVFNEFGKTVFAAFTSVEPGASGGMTFHYILPPDVQESIDNGEYVLDVQRQAGVGSVPLGLDLVFDREIVAASPGEVREFWGDGTYTMSTSTKPYQTFSVGF